MAGVASSELYNKTCASQCGIITNISFPFRLPHDPPHCGLPKYELACENNVTLLRLHQYDRFWKNVTYRVVGINYDNLRIKLVDPGIQAGNCSSLPLYSLSADDFNYFRSPYDYYVINGGAGSLLLKQVAYLNCSDPVREDTAYVDTAPCVKGGGHLYAMAGDLLAPQFQPQCRLEFVTPVASDWESLVPDGIKSYADIHTLLSFGFELSWLGLLACRYYCPDGTYCRLSTENGGLLCLPMWSDCTSPLGISYKSYESCDYLLGIWQGIYHIAFPYDDYDGPYDDYEGPPADHDEPAKLSFKLGVFTGRFVLPFITARFLFGVVLLSTVLIYTCRRRHLSIYEDIEDFIRLHDLIPIRYSYKDLKTMTENFKNKLGEGGFATVYKGKLRSGPEVAIKMLGKSNKANNGQDFMSEVATIGRIHHFNVIHEISLGVARGIAYLHHGCEMQILHFDIKPHNILLDENFTPKISDFGLACLYAIDGNIATLTARGTMGYIAPELFYKNIGRVSHKVDVYSFGMLLMEMASQRRNLNPQAEHSSQLYYPLWIYDHFDDNKDIEMEDLMEEEKSLVKKMFIVALWCIQLKPVDRPSMNKVIEMLEANDVSSLQMPPKPPLYPNERVLVDDISNSDETTSIVSIHSHSDIGEGTSNGK
ncbi:hypothetical protein K1719_016477 [Acacia pycnantha]|nr:hypothetical protein K1719_016477 [Acacia pycnantha]